MPAAETTSELLNSVIGIGLLLILAILVVAVLYYVFGKKKGFKDTWKELFVKLKDDSIKNMPDHMKRLYRMPIPPLNEYLGAVDLTTDEGVKKRDEVLERLRDIFHGQRTASVYLGEMVGFNRIDMLATIEGMLVPIPGEASPVERASEQQLKEVKDVLSKCGKFINIITYKPKNKKLLNFDKEEVIIAWDDQVLGLLNCDGDLYVLGQGTDKIAMYFSVVSGYADRVKAVLTYLTERSWIDWSTRMQMSMVEVVETGMRMDTTTQKVLTASALQGQASKLKSEK